MQVKNLVNRAMKFFFCILAAVMLFFVAPAQAQEPAQEAYPADFLTELNNKLLVAAYDNDTASVLRLIASGAEVNTTTLENVTPLMYAAQNGNTGIIKILLTYDADPNLRSVKGYTALITAVRADHLEAAEYLIRNGANINLADYNKNTPLLHAAALDLYYQADMLIYYDADISLKNKNGGDALMMSSMRGNSAIALLLVEKGADVNAADQSGRTPLHYAAQDGYTGIMEMLIQHGASLETKTTRGYSPLSMAVAAKQTAAARLLISEGADVNSHISGSWNPLALAIDNKNDSLITMLRNNDAREILKPSPQYITIGSGYLFQKNDTRLDFSLGLSDNRYNLAAGLGFGFRTSAVQVLKQESETVFYQYWEKRYYLTAAVDKAFYFPTHRFPVKAGAFVRLSESLTFGGYRGSKDHPETSLVFSPGMGIVLEYKFLRLHVSYQYLDLQLDKYGCNWTNISLDVLFNRKKNTPKTASSYGL